ncbi:DsbA family oxidoreductase [Pseudomonas sp. Fig-3]|uniref:DsbA family oxidoreductase n=1 Tax=unclassified Pseudomonas TaxID=196821 RepID=UPI00111279E3|nr:MULTISPECIES: DsbA family oxidoreductase [unclassified Pseudomonas]MBD0706538.1 disulfide bond formation protein DsbA [Pseudomonas sp. PSB1]MDR8386656.1 DsbA family oxidoreductase [Pseudomonas sp. JL2]TNB80507.1 DsbA family oxidoreductase [Pseudomonas sp. Fig-3]WNZ80514.1 DsbA family oxidoreductase [Pseudomonas sp. P105]
MTSTVSIDFVSDVVCPWCALGATALEQAIKNVAGEVSVKLTYKPFELNPDMPAEGEDAVQHMIRKYGRSAEEVTARNQMVIARGQAIGFRFDLEKRSHFYNTFDAHRLLYWALQEGRQIELKKVLFAAYFTDGQNPSDRQTLVRLAANAGLNSARALEVLASEVFAKEVLELEKFYRQRGITSVPAMILDGRQLVSGAQSIEDYEKILRHMAQAPAQA